MKKRKVLFSGIMLFSALCSLTIFNGCKDSVVSPAADNVEISVFSTTGLVAENSSATIVLDSIKVLIKDIQLNVSGNSDTSNIKTGPFVVSLNPNSSVNIISSALIPNGSYDRVKFEIHKLEDADGAIDPIFSFGGGKYSAVVYGKYNGTAFIYRSDKSAKEILSFTPPAVVNSTTKSNVTLKVQPYTWFWNGSDYMDPTLSSNANNIDNNIKASFKAFKDNDHNGIGD